MAFALKNYSSSSSQSLDRSIKPRTPLPPCRRAAFLPSQCAAIPKATLAVGPPPPLTAASATGGISETFAKLKKKGKVAFIPYITAGDPDLSTTSRILKLLDYCGADVIELGLPFSDPYLDGPVIQASAKRALKNGTKFGGIMSMLEEVVPQLSCPIALFSYFNPILKYDVRMFMSTIRNSGVSGLIVPDLSFEESASVRRKAAENNIKMVMFTSPTTQSQKMRAIANASEGFIYLMSSVGVTGIRSSLNPQLQNILKEIKEVTTKPVAVGFGISKPDHVLQISRWGADGVIIGSAIVKLLAEAKSTEEGLRNVETYVKSMIAALP